MTTDTDGCREVVQDGVNGLLVPPGDVDALAAAVGRLARDPVLRRGGVGRGVGKDDPAVDGFRDRAAAMTADVLIARPLGIVATVLGSAVFVVNHVRHWRMCSARTAGDGAPVTTTTAWSDWEPAMTDRLRVPFFVVALAAVPTWLLASRSGVLRSGGDRWQI